MLLRRNPLQTAECRCRHLAVLHSPSQHQAVLNSRLPVLSRWQWSLCITRTIVHASKRTAASTIAGKLAVGTRWPANGAPEYGRSLLVAVPLSKTDCGSAPCASNAGMKQSIIAARAREPSVPAIATLAHEVRASSLWRQRGQQDFCKHTHSQLHLHRLLTGPS